MACSCSKNKQPTGFAATPRTGAQAEQRAGAASVPGAIAPEPRVRPTGSK